jgi:hypothetical protein
MKKTKHYGIDFTFKEYEMIDELMKHYKLFNKSQFFRIMLYQHYREVFKK